MKPFNSSKFFSDPFFSEDIQLGDQTIKAVITERELLSSDGGISSRVGEWLDVAIMKPDVFPALHSIVTVRGVANRIEVIKEQGDVLVLSVLADQRRKI